MVLILAPFRGSPLEGFDFQRTTNTCLRFGTGEPSTHQLATHNFKTRVIGREYRATNYIANVITQGPYPARAKRARHLLAYQLWGNLGSPDHCFQHIEEYVLRLVRVFVDRASYGDVTYLLLLRSCNKLVY
jgi:hypothetical protein